MKIVFITRLPHAAASEMYWHALKSIPNVFFYDGKVDLKQFDIALVMTYDHLLVQQIRQKAPNVKVGIIDPRTYKVTESAKLCDFLVIDSIEMELPNLQAGYVKK